MPATTDLDTLDVVTISVTGLPSFMTYDGASKELKIDRLEDELNTYIPISNYFVSVTLNDDQGGSTLYQIELNVLEAPNRDPEWAEPLLEK